MSLKLILEQRERIKLVGSRLKWHGQIKVTPKETLPTNETCECERKKIQWLHGRMERYSIMSSGLQPAFKADDQHCPTKCKASDSNSNVENHHHIIVTPTHSSKCDLLITEYENQASARQEETGQGFRRRTRGKDRAWGAEPDEEISQASQDSKPD